jgi:hypothetical protein
LANELVDQFKLPLTPFGQQRQTAPAASVGGGGGIKIESVEVIP